MLSGRKSSRWAVLGLLLKFVPCSRMVVLVLCGNLRGRQGKREATLISFTIPKCRDDTDWPKCERTTREYVTCRAEIELRKTTPEFSHSIPGRKKNECAAKWKKTRRLPGCVRGNEDIWAGIVRLPNLFDNDYLLRLRLACVGVFEQVSKTTFRHRYFLVA